MPIDARLMTLVQWLSPAYPTGAFAWSHGVEQAVAAGWIADAEGLEDWLRDCLTDGSGCCDAILLRLAFAAPDPLEIDAMARAFAPGHERIAEAARQGAAFARTTRGVWGLEMPDLMLPVAVGHGARLADLVLEDVVPLYLQAFVSNLVSAAQRLMPLGQTAGQQVLLNVQQTCIDVAAQTQGAGENDVFSNAFASDIAAMRHETLEPRIFQS